jgi:formamidopyrimidine-DNA glycosylase
MPELPEAETIARQLNERLAGARLGEVRALRPDVVHGDPRPLNEMLPGLRVDRVYRRAKRVVFDLETQGSRAKGGPRTMIVHLGMTGRLSVCPADEQVEKHTHLRVAIHGRDDELRFRDPRRFGGIWVLPAGVGVLASGTSPERAAGLGPLGPEPLQLQLKAFAQLLQRKRAIKSLLLDQSIIAGLGNIYCDESLFASGIRPLRRANSLGESEARALLRAIKATLRRAINFNGSTLMDYRTTDGRPGSFQRFHKVYNRGGKPCLACTSTIEKILVAGRSSWFCPTCQPDGEKSKSRNSARKNAKRRGDSIRMNEQM